MKIAYFHCFAGASGDMILGALLDAGVPLESLTSELAHLPIEGYQIRSIPARRGAISGTQALVEVERERQFSINDIQVLVEASSLPTAVKERSILIFRRLAAAEARVHGGRAEDVHFHEVGAVDAVVDIVGSVLGLYLLGVEEVYASPLPSGGGTVESGHGTLPIPAPATLELIASAGAPMRPTKQSDLSQTEMVTPTGAAILTTLASFREPVLRLERIGYGVGGRDLGSFPNVLPLWLGERVEDGEGDLYLLETNIDDSTPEVLGYVLERLLAQGARDAWFTPIQMKKNRPAVMVSVLVGAEGRGTALQTLLQETSTLGVRVQPIRRHEAEREELRFTSSLGEALVMVKVKRLGGKVANISPEYEDCRRLAVEKGLPLLEVYRIVEREAREKLEK
ncbi:MAG: nickel pincer cofactor biosynthesis protein LarC [Dehalococcoidia bacterium]|nr:nickel pincer cofactor biosynthesis protein LarC [Dehalococcoidia bacterium]